MNKSVLGLIIGVVVILAVGGFALTNKSDKDSAKDSAHSSMGGMDMNNNSEGNSSSNSSGGVEDLTGQTEITMDIKDFDFSKNNIKIKKGTKVTWTNQDTAKHNATSDDAGGPKGELLDQGASYSFTFDTVGTINYYCSPHPYMKATVSVVE